ARDLAAVVRIERPERTVVVLDDADEQVDRAPRATLVVVLDLDALATGHQHAVYRDVPGRVQRDDAAVVADPDAAVLRVDADDVDGIEVVARGRLDVAVR